MTIALTDGTTLLALADDLRWTDEATWSPVERSVERSITGELLVQSATCTNSAGRPITLAPPDDASAWMPRSTLVQLMAWAAVAGQVLSLDLGLGGGRTVTVKLDFGGTTSTVRTDEEGANALLQVLEAAKRATGG